jgi:hypothetical protein
VRLHLRERDDAVGVQHAAGEEPRLDQIALGERHLPAVREVGHGDAEFVGHLEDPRLLRGPLRGAESGRVPEVQACAGLPQPEGDRPEHLGMRVHALLGRTPDEQVGLQEQPFALLADERARTAEQIDPARDGTLDLRASVALTAYDGDLRRHVRLRSRDVPRWPVGLAHDTSRAESTPHAAHDG